MHATGITANLSVADLAEARDFYMGFLGLSVEGFNLGWVVNLHSPDGRAVVQLVTGDATSPVDSVISVHVGDGVEAFMSAMGSRRRMRRRSDVASRSFIR